MSGKVDSGEEGAAIPTHYERIGFEGRRPLLLRVTAETVDFLVGIEVRSDGDEVVPRGADEREHIIDKTLIVRRQEMRMNRHYGELEPARPGR